MSETNEEWISVSEQLPPLCEVVIARAPKVVGFDDEAEYEVFLDYGGYFMQSDTRGYVEGVTVWRSK